MSKTWIFPLSAEVIMDSTQYPTIPSALTRGSGRRWDDSDLLVYTLGIRGFLLRVTQSVSATSCFYWTPPRSLQFTWTVLSHAFHRITRGYFTVHPRSNQVCEWSLQTPTPTPGSATTSIRGHHHYFCGFLFNAVCFQLPRFSHYKYLKAYL